MKDIKPVLKKFLPKIREAKEKGLNEADTRMRIRLLFSDVLGYDLLEDITQEHMVQSHYVDLTVKAKLWDSKQKKYDQKIVLFVEVKSVDTTIRQTHAYQAVNYAATGGIDLVLLTNLIEYQLYHIRWDKKAVEPEQVMAFNILDDDLNEVAEKLKLLTRDSFRKGQIHKYLQEATTLSDRNFMTALLSPRVLSAIRNSLKDITGHRISNNDAIVRNIRLLFNNDSLYDEARCSALKCWPEKPTKEKKPEASKVVEKMIGESIEGESRKQ